MSSTCSSEPGVTTTLVPSGTCACTVTSRAASSSDQASRRQATSSPRSIGSGLGPRRVGAREREQRRRPGGEPVDLGERSLEARLPLLVDVALEVLEPEPERRERRAQLVGGVGDELLLRAKQRCRASTTVSLSSAASARISGGPESVGARAWRSPAPTAAAVCSSSESGLVSVRANVHADDGRHGSTTPPIAPSRSQ